MPNAVLISGSPTATSRLNGLIDVVRNHVQSQGWTWNEIEVRLLPPEDLIYTRFDSLPILEANRLIREADAVVVATPIYKASYTGVLKTFLDLIPQKGLEHKIVLPIAVGGTIAHLLAIDYALKPVLSALGASHIFPGVYGVDSQIVRQEEEGFHIADELLERLHQSLAEWNRAVERATGHTQPGGSHNAV